MAELKRLAIIQTKEALTMDEATAFTGLSKWYLYKLVSEKRIPFYKSEGGGRTYFKKSELNNWLLAARYDSIEETEERTLKTV